MSTREQVHAPGASFGGLEDLGIMVAWIPADFKRNCLTVHSQLEFGHSLVAVLRKAKEKGHRPHGAPPTSNSIT